MRICLKSQEVLLRHAGKLGEKCERFPENQGHEKEEAIINSGKNKRL